MIEVPPESSTIATPVTTRAGEAATSTTTEVPRGELIIHATGDVNVDPGYIGVFAATGYETALAGVESLFTSDSLTIINLECPVTDLGTAADKTFTFQCDPSALPALAAAGVDVANQANNHVLDYGIEAMLDSVDRLEAAGMEPVGVGANVADATTPALFDINGWTIAVLGFGGVVPAPSWIATDERPGMADGDTIESMVAAVEAADALADLVIVTIHWGVELDTTPRADDVARAEAMIGAGADAIFGHHSHRLNPMEMVGGRPVAWGLGNFVWPRLSAAGSRTAVARVVVHPDGSIVGCLLPAEIVTSGHPELTEPPPEGCVGA